MLSECSFIEVYSFSTDCSSDISQANGIILSILLIDSNDFSEVATPITFMPFSAKIDAISFPIPRDAPVTRAVLFE